MSVFSSDQNFTVQRTKETMEDTQAATLHLKLLIANDNQCQIHVNKEIVNYNIIDEVYSLYILDIYTSA